jgi:signal transduction histidine kinase
VDREGLEKVLFQLVVNARDAMPSGGRLVIEARSGAGLPGATHANGVGKPPSYDVLLQISDTGTGMNLDMQARMFEPFFSTKETNIGLGLTMVYEIVKQNGGKVEVDSRPGQGTVVRVWLPGVKVANAQEEQVPKSMLAKGDETILLVEEKRSVENWSARY